MNKTEDQKQKEHPRNNIIQDIFQNRLGNLLNNAGQIHGHFCPGLAMGVMAATRASQELQAFSDGMEDVIAITETNNCFADGLQYVTGCSFGNNALIFKDYGKIAFTLATRNGKGVRVCTKPGIREIIQNRFPDYQRLYQQVVTEQNHDETLKSKLKQAGIERSFGMLDVPFDQLFTLTSVQVDLPQYAPMHNSVTCASCGESVMETRSVQQSGQTWCYACAGHTPHILTGHGINPAT